MQPYKTIEATPTTRVQVHYDQFPESPLQNWSHGVQFVELSPARHSRAYRDYTSVEDYNCADHYPDVPPLNVEPDRYREFPNYYDDEPEHMQPSLRRYLDRHCAAWGIVNRNNYDGTLTLYQSDRDKEDMIEDAEAIAIVTRAMYRHWQMIPEGKPMPRGYRAAAADQLQTVIEEYNKWAIGDVYGIEVERHNPGCPYCDDHANPDQGCPCWDSVPDEYDTGWGLIGSDYAKQEAERIADQLRQEEQREEEHTAA